MKKLLSINYSDGAFNVAMLFLRVTVSVLMMSHGYQKLVGFGDIKDHFISFLGLGATLSLILCIFAEFFCSILLILGLFTRLAAIPLIINMCVIVFKVNHADFFGKGVDGPCLYLICYVVLLLIGPGKASVDNMIGK
ncbi:DoxX family protein [Ferruginibacter albus]|uniref:DoxX family protein n=1 Tax=Ferruginibacter albus TaxID=2875540 RepID=UPI001CC386DE|nr:DoxX family protein [Ferruginibacter albus]UAY51116.1 DoxX family protein [Ferruginibacter albus]